MTDQPMQTFVPEEMPARAAYRLMLSSIVPRPIAWVSTLGPEGTPNLAPYSFFNGISSQPLIIMLAIAQKSERFGGGAKDTLYNLQATGEFVINIVDVSLAEAMNQTAGEWPYATDEFALAGLQSAPSVDVRPPRVAGARVALETRLHQIVPVSGSTTTIVLGRIVRFHVRADLLRENGLIDSARLEPLARLGGAEYATLGEIFALERPRVEPED